MSQSSSLFQSAHASGVISKKSLQALSVTDIGNQIQAAVGIPAMNLQTSEAIVLTMLIDDSGSMSSNQQAAIDGHNLILDALLGSAQKDSILASTQLLNKGLLFPYCMLDQATRLDTSNYWPAGGTPLYKQAVVMLGGVLNKILDCEQNGIPVRTISVILSDGGDNGSGRVTASQVNAIVTDILRKESIVIGVGVDDGYTDFRKVFRSMGIEDHWILTPKNSETEIRQACQLISKAAVRASQSAASFSQTAMGGFGTP